MFIKCSVFVFSMYNLVSLKTRVYTYDLDIKKKPLWLKTGSFLLGIILVLTAIFFIYGGIKLISLGEAGIF